MEVGREVKNIQVNATISPTLNLQLLVQDAAKGTTSLPPRLFLPPVSLIPAGLSHLQCRSLVSDLGGGRGQVGFGNTCR